MDLPREATLLRLDQLAVLVDAALTSAAVPHALLKGASTTRWLYPEGRMHYDVDVLVPASRVSAAAGALAAAGLATSRSGAAGEEAEHSLLLHSPDGFEIDLHRSLPSVPVSELVWTTLAPHVTTLALDVGVVTALDEPGRCLVLALHAAHSGPGEPGPAEDLRRARHQAAAESWRWARDAAARLGVADLLSAGLVRAGEQVDGPLSRRAALLLAGAPAPAIGLQRLLSAPGRQRPGIVIRELVPSPGFLRRAYPDLTSRRFGLLRAHLRRWAHLVRAVPAAVRAWRDTSSAE
ncbi:nucleotidyltransferase family protein [Jatrophihabitans sp.]|uniref:nucleotidyltransferase family protein n=1 Tax=Jatrophihabitans sp. TaxID=1932789 RepID=UPI0030C705B2